MSFIRGTVNGEKVAVEPDSNADWVCVMNYEHYSGERPGVTEGSTFPTLPNGVSDVSTVNNLGTSGEVRHVDNISQYGTWNADAVRIEGVTSNHSRKIHFISTDQTVIDAVENTATPVYTDFQGSTTTELSDHSANLPAAADGDTQSDSTRIFEKRFPFFNSGTYHWAIGDSNNNHRWAVDDHTTSNSTTGEQYTTVHRVWARPTIDMSFSSASVVGKGNDSITLEINDETEGESEFRIYRSTTSGVTTSDTLAGSISTSSAGTTGSTYTFEDAGLSPNTTYYYAVAVYDGANETQTGVETSDTTLQTGVASASVTATAGAVSLSASGTSSAITTASATASVSADGGSAASTTASGAVGFPVNEVTVLPDEDAPLLGNGVEDEVAVDRESAVSDYGDVRVQIRETGESTWDSSAIGYAEHLLDHATLTDNFLNREDGEEYEVRGRTETEHVIGAWSTTSSIVTKFPGASSLATTVAGQTAIDLSWNDNSDNEDGFRIYRREQLDDTSWSSWVTEFDLAPNTTTHTDGTVQPGVTYEYYVEAYTEHSTGSSSVVSATSNTTSLHQRQVSSSGPYIEVDHASGATVVPTVIDEPKHLPSINELPRAEIRVPASDKWTDTGFDRADVRVWHDGSRLPLDTLVSVDVGSESTRLTLRGGAELLSRVQKSVDQQEAHLLARDLVQNNTGYAINADAPSSSQSSSLQQNPDTQSELSGLQNTVISSDDPAELSNGVYSTKQTAWTVEAEDYDSGSTGRLGAPRFSGDSTADGNGDSIEFDVAGDYAEWTFTTDHDIPSGSFRIHYRNEGSGDLPSNVQWSLNGSVIGETDDLLSLGWSEVYTHLGITPPALSAGTHKIRAETGTEDTDLRRVDVLAPLDDRFSYTFDNSTTSSSSGGQYLDGPEHYPDKVPIEFVDSDPVHSVVGGDLNVTMNNVAGDSQLLEMSNDGGTSWVSASNTSSFSTTFGSSGGTIRARVTLSRFGNREVTPATGYKGQTLDAYEMYADLDTTPTVINRVFDGKLKDVLATVAEEKDAIWELQYDGGFSVEWTQPGRRSAEVSEDIADYRVEKDATSVNQKAIIRGASQRVRQEDFTSDYDVAVALSQDNLIPGKEAVYDPSNGTSYDRGQDYEMDWPNGSITVLSSGSMADATAYAIDYQYKVYGEYSSGAYSGDPEEEYVDTLPAVTTDGEAQQAALSVVSGTDTPLWKANITIDKRPAGFSLVDSISFEELPSEFANGGAEVWNLEDTASRVELTLGSRRRVESVVKTIQSGLKSTQDRV